ncbi:MAG TPA: signal peptidase I [Verrucomicrobiae bacterium]|nr:signal peptidase I [Verrucomicrobiae bacterium]
MAQDTTTNPPPKRNWFRLIVFGRSPRRTMLRIVILVVVCFFVFKFMLIPIRVTGISMSPTYKDDSVNFVNRFAYWWHEPQRGDVVGIQFAGPHLMLLKRIVGLPGETISFENGRVMINSQPLAESYEKGSCNWNMPAEKIGADEYYVVGDNREMPQSLHMQGRVERWRILGKALL